MIENGEGTPPDLKKAIELHEKSANLGNNESLNYLGCLYYEVSVFNFFRAFLFIFYFLTRETKLLRTRRRQ